MGVPSREGGFGRDLLTDVLLLRSHCSRSPNGTYSITRNLFSYMVQHPTKDTIFWCEPNCFIFSISCKNSSFCSSLGLSRHKERSNSVLSMVRVSTLKRKVLWIKKPYKSVIEANAKTTISKKSLADMT